jgi:hypothetical protein
LYAEFLRPGITGRPCHGTGVVCIARQSQAGSAKGWADQYVRRRVIDLGCDIPFKIDIRHHNKGTPGTRKVLFEEGNRDFL